MKDLVKFEFEGKGIRAGVDASGEPFWIGKDVCDTLRYGNYRDALRKLDDDEKGVVKTDTLGGGRQDMISVTESGLYTLIIRSNKPEAKKFRRWITHEVLPQLRRTGSYISPEAKRVLDAFERDELIPAKVADLRLRIIRLRTDEWSRRCLRSDIRALVARSKSMTPAKYGNWERYRRQDLTQAERALLLGISRDSLRRFEAGVRTIEQEHAIVDTQWRDFTRPPRRGELSLLEGGAR